MSEGDLRANAHLPPYEQLPVEAQERQMLVLCCCCGRTPWDWRLVSMGR
jgi:hypothetical protein